MAALPMYFCGIFFSFKMYLSAQCCSCASSSHFSLWNNVILRNTSRESAAMKIAGGTRGRALLRNHSLSLLTSASPWERVSLSCVNRSFNSPRVLLHVSYFNEWLMGVPFILGNNVRLLWVRHCTVCQSHTRAHRPWVGCLISSELLRWKY